MSGKLDVTRRTFLGGIGATIGLSSVTQGTTKFGNPDWNSSNERINPDFSGRNELRPHILTWGGNSAFIVNKGIQKTPHERRRKTVLETHPEAFWAQGLTGFDGPPSDTRSVANRIRGELELARDLGFDTPFGRPTKFTTENEKEWYSNLPSEEKWRWPDGSIVESHIDVGVRRLDGTMVKGDGSECEEGDCEVIENYPSIHVDGVREFFGQMATDYVAMGTNGIWLDQFDARGRQPDFSAWAVESFREHLKGLSPSELDQLGVEEPESLDIKNEILERSPRSSDAHPAEDPLYREYTKFDLRANKEFARDIRRRLADEYPDRDPEEFLIFGNLFGPFENPHTVTIFSDPLTLPVGESQETVPPDHVFDFNVKFYVAAGRFEKSGFHQGRPFLLGEERFDAVKQLDLDEPQTDYCTIQFAEQVANRAVGVATFQGDCCYGPIQKQPGNWIRPDGSLPDELEELTGFAWSTRDLLRGGEFVHDVAIVRSVPTNLWEAGTGFWNRSNEPIYSSFGGAANILMEEDRPYDVLIFGHPDLWDDTVMLDRLSSYEQVVLPSAVCLSAAQRASLVEALDGGLHVIVTDERPRRTADYQPLSDTKIDELLGHPNTTVLSGTPARDYWNSDGNGDAVRTALAKHAPLVSTDADSDLELTVQRQSDPERVVLQAVNYDFDLSEGEVRSHTDLTVDLRRAFDLEVLRARYYRPGNEPSDLQINRTDERLHVELPELDVWGVVVFGPDDDAVSMNGSESTASDKVETAREAVSTAAEEGRTDGLEDARQFLSYAETGIKYNAFDRAETEASKAIRNAEAATEPPRVGIDVAHNQPEVDMGYDTFKPFREAFVRDVEFAPVEEWSEETFADLDILLIPPTKRHEGYEYGFSSRERSLAGQFVERGGGLLFLGDSGIPEDHSTLLDQFNTGFKSGIVQNPDGFGADYITRGEAHQVTQTSLYLESSGPAYVVKTPDDARVLYKYPESANIWRDVCGDDSRQNCDPDASGKPFSTLLTHGEGTVIVHGTTRHITPMVFRGDFTDPWSPTVNFLRNAIHYMVGGETGDSPTQNPGLRGAQDLDGDGLFEDVNGDGTVDSEDAEVLINNLDDPVVNDNPSRFDFDEDGEVTEADGQELYLEQYGDMGFNDVLQTIADFNDGGIPSFDTVLDAISRFNDRN